LVRSTCIFFLRSRKKTSIYLYYRWTMRCEFGYSSAYWVYIFVVSDYVKLGECISVQMIILNEELFRLAEMKRVTNLLTQWWWLMCRCSFYKKNLYCNNWYGTGDIYHVFSSARTKIECGSNFVQFDVQQRIIIANLSSVIVFMGMKKIRK